MTTISERPGAGTDLHTDDAIDEALAALDIETNFSPKNNPGIEDRVKKRAVWLNTVARQWPGADNSLRAQTQTLSRRANEFLGNSPASATQLYELDCDINQLPQGLHHVAAHLDAFAYDQRELSRLSTALDRIAGGGHRYGISEPDFAGIRATAQRIASAIDAGRSDLMAGRMRDLHDDVTKIKGQTASLRGLLERKKVIHPDDALPETPHPEPIPSAARRTVSPATLLRGALSRVAHTAQSARNALVQHLSPQRMKEAKLAEMARRKEAQAPLREELSLLDDDLSGAEFRVSIFGFKPGVPDPQSVARWEDRTAWVSRTLNPILKAARRTQAAGLRALARSSKPEAVAQQAIVKLRAQLTAFNAALDERGEDMRNFKFQQRPWPPVAGPDREGRAA